MTAKRERGWRKKESEDDPFRHHVSLKEPKHQGKALLTLIK
jgi:hypothetical protein